MNRNMVIGGKLVAAGTPAEPVVFTSYQDDTYGGDTNGDGSATVPAPSDWWSIQINNTGEGLFDHTVIKYGGNNASGALLVNGGKLTIRNSTVSHSASNGIYGGGYYDPNRGWVPSPVVVENVIGEQNHAEGVSLHHLQNGSLVRNSTFRDNGGGATITEFTLANGQQIAGLTVTGNTRNRILLDYMTVGCDVTMPTGTPYEGSMTVQQGYTLTLLPGTAWKMNRNMVIGGKLVAAGTPAEPVVFTSYQDDTYGGDTNGDGSADRARTRRLVVDPDQQHRRGAF